MENCLKYFSQECHNHYVKFGHKKKILSKPTQVEWCLLCLFSMQYEVFYSVSWFRFNFSKWRSYSYSIRLHYSIQARWFHTASILKSKARRWEDPSTDRQQCLGQPEAAATIYTIGCNRICSLYSLFLFLFYSELYIGL